MPKSWSHRREFQRDAGKQLRLHCKFVKPHCHVFSIVEFGSQEDAQRAIRELSEVPLLGRPVFIREVCTLHMLSFFIEF